MEMLLRNNYEASDGRIGIKCAEPDRCNKYWFYKVFSYIS